MSPCCDAAVTLAGALPPKTSFFSSKNSDEVKQRRQAGLEVSDVHGFIVIASVKRHPRMGLSTPGYNLSHQLALRVVYTQMRVVYTQILPKCGKTYDVIRVDAAVNHDYLEAPLARVVLRFHGRAARASFTAPDGRPGYYYSTVRCSVGVSERARIRTKRARGAPSHTGAAIPRAPRDPAGRRRGRCAAVPARAADAVRHGPARAAHEQPAHNAVSGGLWLWAVGCEL